MTRSQPPPGPTVLVADDEPLARRRVLGLLKRHEAVRVVGQSSTGPATVDAVRRLEPDLLFLDVQMPGLDGFQVLATLRAEERPVVVFSTAYDEYALAAFEVHAVDYLLKPYADERFDEALRRAERALRSERDSDLRDRLRDLLAAVGLEGPGDAGETPPGRAADRRPPEAEDGPLDRFAVRTGERVAVIDAGDVDRIEAEGDYVTLHVGPARHLLRGTMSSLERRLDPRRFVRIHRSTIVRVDRIDHLRPGSHGDYRAVMEGGRELPVGRTYRDALLERLGMRW